MIYSLVMIALDLYGLHLIQVQLDNGKDTTAIVLSILMVAWQIAKGVAKLDGIKRNEP